MCKPGNMGSNHPLIFVVSSLLLYASCSQPSPSNTLFSDLTPIVKDLSIQGNWKASNELIRVNLLFDDNLDKKDKIFLQIVQAENYRYLEEYVKAWNTFQLAIQSSKSYHIPDYLDEAYYGLGDLSYLNWSYFKQENALKTSHDFLDSAMSCARKTGNKKVMSKVLYRKGAIFQIEGDEKKSQEHFQKGLAIAFAISDTVEMIRNHTHTAVALRRSQNRDSAFYHYGQAYKLAHGINRNYSEAHCLANLGSYYLEIGDIPIAEYYYQQANFLAKELGHGIVICKGLYGLATIQEKQGRKPEALDLATDGLKLAKERGYKNFENAFSELIKTMAYE